MNFTYFQNQFSVFLRIPDIPENKRFMIFQCFLNSKNILLISTIFKGFQIFQTTAVLPNLMIFEEFRWFPSDYNDLDTDFQRLKEKFYGNSIMGILIRNVSNIQRHFSNFLKIPKVPKQKSFMVISCFLRNSSNIRLILWISKGFREFQTTAILNNFSNFWRISVISKRL